MRHVRSEAARCPFCAGLSCRSLLLHRAAAGAAVLMTACTPPQQDTIVPMGAPAVSVSAEPPPPAASSSASSALDTPASPASASAPPDPPIVASAEPDPPDPGPPGPRTAPVYGPPPSRDRAAVYGPPPRDTQARTTDEVRRVFLAARKQFRQCWDQASPGAQTGRASLRVSIAGNGLVAAAEIFNSDLPHPVNQCILRESRKMRFPPASDATTVVFPLVFQR